MAGDFEPPGGPPPGEEPPPPGAEPLPPAEEPLPPGEEPLPPGEEPQEVNKPLNCAYEPSVTDLHCYRSQYSSRRAPRAPPPPPPPLRPGVSA